MRCGTTTPASPTRCGTTRRSLGAFYWSASAGTTRTPMAVILRCSELGTAGGCYTRRCRPRIRHLCRSCWTGTRCLSFGEGEYGMTDMFYAAAKGRGADVFKQMLDHAMSPRCSTNCWDGEGANISGGGRGSRDVEQGRPRRGSRDDEHGSQWRRLLLPSSGCPQVAPTARSWPSLPQAPFLPRSCGKFSLPQILTFLVQKF
uniref:Uncharacterized protein n=1 Tax=Arundo donax TaxID=35708 RepID=A0A0A9C6G2_ARUDO